MDRALRSPGCEREKDRSCRLTAMLTSRSPPWRRAPCCLFSRRRRSWYRQASRWLFRRMFLIAWSRSKIVSRWIYFLRYGRIGCGERIRVYVGRRVCVKLNEQEDAVAKEDAEVLWIGDRNSFAV